MNLLNSRDRCNLLLNKKGDFIYDIQQALWKYKNINEDAFSIGQIKSKLWAIEILEDIQRCKQIDYGIVFVLCGWYGLLPAFMFYSSLLIDKIRSFDIDESCYEIADYINKTNYDKDWRFKGITDDIFNINFDSYSWSMWSKINNRMSYLITESPNTIINTSCEHTSPEWFKNIPKGKFVILQTNNSFSEDGHINPVENIDKFIEMYPVNEIYYKGTINLEKYKRFMLVGIK